MWINNFDRRQQQEIEFAKLYADRFSHGTDGHNAKLVIAKMAKMLDDIEAAMNPVQGSPYFMPGGVSLRPVPPAPSYFRWDEDGEFEDFEDYEDDREDD